MLLYCPLLTDTRLSSFKVLRDFVKYHIGDKSERQAVYRERKKEMEKFVLHKRRSCPVDNIQ